MWLQGCTLMMGVFSKETHVCLMPTCWGLTDKPTQQTAERKPRQMPLVEIFLAFTLFKNEQLLPYCFICLFVFYLVIGSAFCCWLQQVNNVGTFRIHTCSRSRQRAVLLCCQAKTRNKIEEWLSNEKAFVFVSFSFSFISVCSDRKSACRERVCVG